MPIEVTPQPAPILSAVNLCEQRTHAGTAFPCIQRIYTDDTGVEVKREADAPQVQLNLSEWPDLAAAHQTYVDLLERAAAYMLGYIPDAGQTYSPTPEPLPDDPPLDSGSPEPGQG